MWINKKRVYQVDNNKKVTILHIKLTEKFYVLLTVHLGIIFVNNQLDAQFLFIYVIFIL